jgi:ABC-2 type transport system permease protein
MSLWRLEWLRLLRTRRLLALVVAFVFFGITSPLLARYRDELIRNVGGGISIVAPPATPADGITNYLSNSAQIGLLVFALVAAGALAFDADRETAIFLRTRVRRARDLVTVKYSVTLLATVAAFDGGALLAWAGSVALIGELPVGPMVIGLALTDLYLAFFGSVVAMVATKSSSVVVTAVTSLAAALLLGVLSVIGAIGELLPSHLVGALPDLAAGGDAPSYARSAMVTLVATAVLLVLAVRTSAQREI